MKPVPFQGDAFETAEDPFGPAALSEQSDDEDTAHSGPDDAGPTALSEQSDDEDGNEEMAHMVAELEQSWEPHREGAPRLEVEDIQVNDSDNEGDTQRRNIDRFIIGDGYGVKPTVRIRYTDKYPNSRAGQPLLHEESRDSRYASALGGGDNPWAPLNSKKDWEFTRWAKLQEMGSTAFSELLAIDGVHYNSLFLVLS